MTFGMKYQDESSKMNYCIRSLSFAWFATVSGATSTALLEREEGKKANFH